MQTFWANLEEESFCHSLTFVGGGCGVVLIPGSCLLCVKMLLFSFNKKATKTLDIFRLYSLYILHIYIHIYLCIHYSRMILLFHAQKGLSNRDALGLDLF